MNARRIFVVLFIGGMALLSSCGHPADPIVCPPADLVAPMLISPPDYAYTSSTTQPYPTPAPEYKCRPNQFRVSLSMAPLFNTELGGVGPGALSVTWTTPALQAGQTYRWSVVAISKGKEGPPSQTRYFSIGNICASATDLKPPNPLMPPNTSRQDTLTPEVMWGSPTGMTCLPRGYVIQYSTSANFGTFKWLTGHGPAAGFYMKLPELQNCTTYYWRVAAHLSTSVGATAMPSPTGPYSDTWSFDVALPGTCLQSPFIPPQEAATLPPGPVPPVSKFWQVTMNANCRAGPGTAYNEKGFAPKGFAVEVEGRNEDGTWFRLIDPSGISCWVSEIALEVPADWEIQPVLAYPLAPPPPEAPPEEENAPPAEVNPPGPPPDPCAQYQGAPACLAQPGCFFDRYKGICVTK
jgi:hypothetical protein